MGVGDETSGANSIEIIVYDTDLKAGEKRVVLAEVDARLKAAGIETNLTTYVPPKGPVARAGDGETAVRTYAGESGHAIAPKGGGKMTLSLTNVSSGQVGILLSIIEEVRGRGRT